jgi:hypothetical protein
VAAARPGRVSQSTHCRLCFASENTDGWVGLAAGRVRGSQLCWRQSSAGVSIRTSAGASTHTRPLARIRQGTCGRGAGEPPGRRHRPRPPPRLHRRAPGAGASVHRSPADVITAPLLESSPHPRSRYRRIPAHVIIESPLTLSFRIPAAPGDNATAPAPGRPSQAVRPPTPRRPPTMCLDLSDPLSRKRFAFSSQAL